MAVVCSPSTVSELESSVTMARLCCATSMRGILDGDLRGVHPFVSSLMELLTVGMPEPRDKSAFVEHVAVRTTYVLGDLFCLARGEAPAIVHEQSTPEEGEETEEAATADSTESEKHKTGDDMSLGRLAQFPLCVACGVLLSQKIACRPLFAGCIVHPQVTSSVGLAWCVLAFAFLVRSLSIETVVSVALGALLVDVRTSFPLLTSCSGVASKSPSSPAQS